MDMSPVGFKSQMCWGLVSWVYVLKVGMLEHGDTKPSLLKEKFWLVSSLLIGGVCSGVGVHVEVVSEPWRY